MQTMQYRMPSNNGQYFLGNAPYPQYPSQSSMRTAPSLVPDQTCARVNTTTITNAVMLEKTSLKVTRDPTVRASTVPLPPEEAAAAPNPVHTGTLWVRLLALLRCTPFAVPHTAALSVADAKAR